MQEEAVMQQPAQWLQAHSVYLACVIASVVQGANQLHHVAHPVLWTRVKHVDIRVEERVAWISHGISGLPCTDGNESIATCVTNMDKVNGWPWGQHKMKSDCSHTATLLASSQGDDKASRHCGNGSLAKVYASTSWNSRY